MDRFFKSVLHGRILNFHMDDDSTDRLSRLYTAVVLVCLGVVVGIKQFAGHPIKCWYSSEFSEDQRDFADTVCHLSITYYWPLDEPLPVEWNAARVEWSSVYYYQWIPLVLLSQAMFVIAPYLVWRLVSKRSGINLPATMDAAHQCSEADYIGIRDKAIQFVVKQIEYKVRTQGTFGGVYLTTFYLVVKILYCVTAIGQLFFLDNVFAQGYKYHAYGLYLIERWIRGQDWLSSNLFPRVVRCQFALRVQSRVQEYNVPCVLPINVYNAKIFAFIWFWIVFLTLVTGVSALRWLFRSLCRRGQVQYLRKLRQATPAPDVQALTKFMQSFLRQDGMFLVRLIGDNVGDVVAADVVNELWNAYNVKQDADIPENRQSV